MEMTFAGAVVSHASGPGWGVRESGKEIEYALPFICTGRWIRTNSVSIGVVTTLEGAVRITERIKEIVK